MFTLNSGRKNALVIGLLFMVAIFAVNSLLAQQHAVTASIIANATAEQRAAMANIIFTVNNTTDDSDADTADDICDTDLLTTGEQCSLRASIEQANATAGLDAIAFNIPGSGPHTIQPSSKLPNITDPVTIDGYTQSGAQLATNNSDAVILIELVPVQNSSSTLLVTGGNSVIRGLAIRCCSPYGGIQLSNSGGNVIEGNYLGTNATGGTTGTGGWGTGVFIRSDANIIGGTSIAQRNLISRNGTGIKIEEASDNQIVGNLIGTDITGTVKLPNGTGIDIIGGFNNTIGGLTESARNIISGNGREGIRISGPRDNSDHLPVAKILGNYIGVDITGVNELGNYWNGIQLRNSDLIDIGDVDSAAQNIIAWNGRNGIEILGGETDAIGNSILSNSIFANGNLGINLGGGGNNVNDIGDVDSGPNNYQNYPFISSIGLSDTEIAISGILGSVANTSYRIEFFSNTVCDESGLGEGENFIGFTNVTTDGQGIASFSVSLPKPVGQFITSTATDPQNNTSEFSLCTQVGATLDTIVTNTNDSGPGSLRTAIYVSQSKVNTVDTISFAIPGQGPHRIDLIRGLPVLNVPTIIDGYTQPGSVPASEESPASLQIELSGWFGNPGSIHIRGGESIVRGLNIHNMGFAAIWLDSDNNLVEGNIIGREEALGGSDRGIHITGSNNMIGGTTIGSGNRILGHYSHGVLIVAEDATNNAIIGNSFTGNPSPAINLGDAGVTLNDPGDADTGPNNLQNFPVLMSSTSYGTQLLIINGNLNSNPNTTYRLEFFANDMCDPSGYGEGETFLGYSEVNTDGNGNVDFSVSLSDLSRGGSGASYYAFSHPRVAQVNIPPEPLFITSTATDSNNNTSEFSACIGSESVYLLDDLYYTDLNTTLTVPAPGVLANDGMVENIQTVSLVSGPNLGELTFNTDGSFTYTPDSNYFGNDSFVYEADYGVITLEAIVTINVAPPPRPEGVVMRTNNTDVPIPEPSGGYCGGAVSIVAIDNAPFGAQVTKVEVSTRVVHPHTGDVMYIDFTNAQSASEQLRFPLWRGQPSWVNDYGLDDDPETDADIDLRNRLFATEFDGNVANQEWAVIAYDCITGGTGYIDSSTVKIHYVPITDPPILMEPQGTIINHYGNPEFVWTDIHGGVYYEIVVVRKSDNKVVVNETGLYFEDYCEYPICTLDLTVLGEENRLNAGEYDVWLRALYSNHQHIVDWSGPFTFTLEADPPDAPTIADVSNFVSTTPTFNWTLDEGPADYASWFQIKIFNRNLSGEITTEVSSVWRRRSQVCGTMTGTECSLVSPVTLPTAKPYAVQIRSYGPGGMSVGWSDYAYFSVGGEPAALPGNITSDPRQGRPIISWDDDPNTTWVQLWIGGLNTNGVMSNFSQWLGRDAGSYRFSCSDGRCAFEPNVNWLNGSYNVWMRAWGPGGYSMGGTDAANAPSWVQGPPLIMDFPVPTATPTGLFASNTETNSPTFNWNSVSGATWYNLVVESTSSNWSYSVWKLAYDISTACGDAEDICSFTDPALAGVLTNGEYSFKVRAWGPGGMSEFSDVP